MQLYIRLTFPLPFLSPPPLSLASFCPNNTEQISLQAGINVQKACILLITIYIGIAYTHFSAFHHS